MGVSRLQQRSWLPLHAPRLRHRADMFTRLVGFENGCEQWWCWLSPPGRTARRSRWLRESSELQVLHQAVANTVKPGQQQYQPYPGGAQGAGAPVSEASSSYFILALHCNRHHLLSPATHG
jgi:hypothetical protein